MSSTQEKIVIDYTIISTKNLFWRFFERGDAKAGKELARRMREDK